MDVAGRELAGCAGAWPGTGLRSATGANAASVGSFPGALVTSFRVAGRCGGQVRPVSGSGLSTAWAWRGLVAGGP